MAELTKVKSTARSGPNPRPERKAPRITPETVIHGVFLLAGLITVGCVLLISVYLVAAGLPAIKKIGLAEFLFGTKWSSTSAEPSFGILPFILTSIYGTAGAVVIGVPIGFFTAVYTAKFAPAAVRKVIIAAVSLLAGIPSVVYGLVGMTVLVPLIGRTFNLSDGAGLLAAMVVLAVMILLAALMVFCGMHGAASVTYTPQLSIQSWQNSYTKAGLMAYIAFLAIPSAVNIWEEARWLNLKSKI